MTSERDHDSSGTSANSTVEDDQAPAQQRWNQQPTRIQIPGRGAQRSMVPATRRVEHAVPGWDSTTPRVKTLKRAHGEDAPSNSRQHATGKQAEPIVVEDEDEEPVRYASSSTRSTRDILGVQPNAPFGSKRVNGALESDTIEDDSDNDSLIVTDINGDKNTRHTTPTRFPAGNVKKKTLLYNQLDLVPMHDFSTKGKNNLRSLKGRMKPKDAAMPSRLLNGKDAQEVSLRRRPSDSACTSAETSSSRFGSAMPTTLHSEQERSRERAERFATVKDDNTQPTSRPPKGAVNGRLIKTPFGTRALPKYGPICLEAFCLGTQRAADGTHFAAWPDGFLAVFSDETMSDCVASIRRKDLAHIETVSVTDANAAASGGGAIIRLKSDATDLNSSAFEAGDSGSQGCIVLKFVPPVAGSSWTAQKRDTLVAFLGSIAPTLGRIPVLALDSLIGNANTDGISFHSEPSTEEVEQQARLLRDIQRANETKGNQKRIHESRRKSDNGIKSYMTPKDKGKGMGKADAPGTGSTAVSSTRKRARDISDDDEALDAELDELDFLGKRDQSSTRSAESGDNGEHDSWYRRGQEGKRFTRSSKRDNKTSLSPPPSFNEESPKPKREPVKNPDEIILVFPKAGPGAINVSRGDYARLEPGEFLNDTLIEFWLKYWLTTLDPVLADQVHVFSSFFYKKLNQKNFDEGYASVRKWTNKVDIFKKKYIIVPINEHIHWYLAIIYQPEHVLKPPPMVEPIRVATRNRAAKLAEADLDRVRAAEQPRRESEDVDALLEARPQSRERTLSADEPVPPSDGDTQPDELPMDVDDTASVAARLEQYSIEDLEDDSNLDPSLRAIHADGTPMPSELSRDRRSVSLGSGLPPPTERVDVDVDEVEVEAAVAPTSPTPVLDVDSDPVAGSQVPPTDNLDDQIARTTYIFTFDSLGTKHPQVLKNLMRYLAADAQDKRGVPADKCTTPVGKKVLVPTQPNYCDCGVYLLHFAETFMSDPVRYVRTIMAPPKKPPMDKNELWRNEAVGTKREFMAEKLTELSALWLQMKREEEERAKEDSKPPQADNAEDDDDVVCEVPVTSKPPKKTTLRAGRTGALD